MTNTPDIYLNPTAPDWLKKMLREEFPNANEMSAEEIMGSVGRALPADTAAVITVNGRSLLMAMGDITRVSNGNDRGGGGDGE
jgi:hypothetical protein